HTARYRQPRPRMAVGVVVARCVRHAWHTRCVFIDCRAVAARRRGRISHTRMRVRMRRAEEGVMVIELINRLLALARGEEGQDLLEYALLVALIALVAVAAITLTGTNVNAIFVRIAAALNPPAGN